MSALEGTASVLVLAGSILALLAGIGLVRFPDVFARMHAATKPATLGLVLVAGAAILRVDDVASITKLVLFVGLQLLTAPVGAHLIGRAAYWAGGTLSPDTVLDELASVDAAPDEPAASPE